VLQWCSTYQKFEYESEQRSGVGTPIYIEEKGGSQLMMLHFKATEWEEDYRLVLELAWGIGVLDYKQVHTIEPVHNGCRYTFSEEIKLPFGFVGRFIGRFAEKASTRTIAKMLQTLKELVEA